MATKIIDIHAGTEGPSSAVQFGGRTIVCYPDRRPIVVMTGPDGDMAAYDAGIKAPTAAPSLAAGAASTIHRITDDVARAAYCFYSSHRKVFSEISPLSTELAFSGTRLTVGSFQAPRDTYSTQDISHIVVGLELKSCPGGLLCVWDAMKVDASDGLWTSKSFTLDYNPDTLRLGFPLHKTSQYSRIPPAFKYAEVHGERIWYAGHQVEVDKSAATCATLNTTWRGRTVCRLTLTNSTWNDADHYMAVFTAAGDYLGIIWDVHSTTVAYLFDSVPTALNSQNIAGVVLNGVNDTIWPSSYHNAFVGQTPIVAPECVCLESRFRVPAITDEVQNIRKLERTTTGLAIVTNDSPVLMTGGTNVNHPTPAFQPIKGVSGTASTRGAAKSPTGEVAWLSTNGPMLLSGGGAQDVALAQGCTRLFRGQEWVDPASIDDSVCCYVRDFDGFIFGRLTIGGTADQWLLYTRRPQVGFFRMSATVMRSNLLEYPSDDGRSVILVGDSTSGRLKRILDPTVLTDLDGSDVATAHTWDYRGGWDRDEDAKRRPVKAFRLTGLVAPSGTVAITGTLWRADVPFRHPSDVDSTYTSTISIDATTLLRDYTFSPASKRYHSLALSGSSTTGTSAGKSWRPLELLRWELIYKDDEDKR